MARNENSLMMQQGVQAQVRPGENSQIHLREHEGERLRYKGVEDQFPNIAMLDQHIAETRFALQNQPQSGGSAPAPNRSQGAGEIMGNQIAGALGG